MRSAPIVLCVFAILGALTLGYMRQESESARRQLELQLAEETVRASGLAAQAAGSRERLTEFSGRVATLETELESARTKLATAETQRGNLDRDLLQARAIASVHEASGRALNGEIAALRQDLAEMRSSHVPRETLAAYQQTITELERQLATASGGATPTGGTGASTAVFSSAIGRANVLSVGPESSFVVINFGSNRGGRLGHRFTISRGTTAGAIVELSDVRPNFSIGQVLPESLRGVLQKGDLAVLVRSP